jgi:hypothetical protein
MRKNTEFYPLYKLPDIIGAIKFAMLRWTGHIHGMSDAEMPQGTIECKPEGRSVGRHKVRWIDDVIEDLRKLGIKSW